MRYEVGDKVVYPGQGVTVVEDITDHTLIGDQPDLCYDLRLLASDQRVIVPVNSTDRVGLRPLSDSDEVGQAFLRLRTGKAIGERNWKNRYQANLDRIKSGLLGDVVDVLLSLADVATRKTLSFREKQMLEKAKQTFAYEVAEVAGREVEEVTAEVDEVIDQRSQGEEEET